MDVNINGVIVPNDDKWVYDWYGLQAVCPNDVERLLDKAPAGEQVDVWLNSGGGSVYDGSQIYTKLKAYSKGAVKIHITGIAASAASVIACAGYCEISPTAQMMIHNASCGGSGDKSEHMHFAELLDVTDRAIANAYRLKTGRSEAEILGKMENETYFTAQEALEFGLVDGIMFDNESKLTAPSLAAAQSGSGLLPKQVLDKCREMQDILKTGDNADTSGDYDNLKKAKAKLKLLNFKNGGIRS